MDIYGTRTLNGVVRSLPRLGGFFLNTFFPEIIVEDSEEIHFDIEDDKPRLSPFVSPLVEGKVVQSRGFETKSFKPAYIKDKRVHTPGKAVKRRIGEAINGVMTPAQRQQANLMDDMADQLAMLDRRLEVMAIDALLDGQVTVSGEGYGVKVVNFGRHLDLTKTLTGAARWTESTAKPLDDIEAMQDSILLQSGASARRVIMDPVAWRVFKEFQQVKDLLETRRGSRSIAETGPVAPTEGATFKGVMGDTEFWVYGGHYINPADGQMTKALPDYTVIVASDQMQGVRQFGAIMDCDSLVAQDTFVKSWAEQDPSVRYLLMQSAPLLVPYRVNAAGTLTVTSGS